MRIERLLLRNAKAITELDATFRTDSHRLKSVPPAIDLICAPNGQGKTTLLEAISLIGHIPCSRKIGKDGAVQNSLYASLTGVTGEIGSESAPPIMSRTLSAEEALSSLPNEYLGVYFNIRDTEPTLDGLKFYVLVDVSEHSLTSLLSAKISDAEFGRYAYIQAAFDCDAKLDTLVRAIARGRTFNPPLSSECGGGPKRFVSFINTDMNDFGRGNDLRESPKTLTADFKSQMVDRIGIRFTSPESPSNLRALADLSELRKILSDVLTTPRYRFSTPDVISPALEILNFELEGDRLKIKVRLKERKGQASDNDPVIDNLSAGENEVLFVFLMLLRFRGEEGIILLDEPDLHVAGYMRPRLFREILRKIDPYRQHVFIVSHSATATSSIKAHAFCGDSAISRVDTQHMDDQVKIKDHLRVLLKVHPEGSKKPSFKLDFDRGFQRMLESGLLAGTISMHGRYELLLSCLSDWRARFVSEMQKSNWAWPPFVASFLSSGIIAILFFLAAWVVPPNGIGDTLHANVVKALIIAVPVSIGTLILLFIYGFVRAIKNKRQDD